MAGDQRRGAEVARALTVFGPRSISKAMLAWPFALGRACVPSARVLRSIKPAPSPPSFCFSSALFSSSFRALPLSGHARVSNVLQHLRRQIVLAARRSALLSLFLPLSLARFSQEAASRFAVAAPLSFSPHPLFSPRFVRRQSPSRWSATTRATSTRGKIAKFASVVPAARSGGRSCWDMRRAVGDGHARIEKQASVKTPPPSLLCPLPFVCFGSSSFCSLQSAATAGNGKIEESRNRKPRETPDKRLEKRVCGSTADVAREKSACLRARRPMARSIGNASA